ncbi:MAG: glycerophosphodiester phosphodiesterase [Spirochaetota bacterium]
MNNTIHTPVIAHRGNSHIYPENTLLSIRQAIELNVHMIEFDVRLTADHKLVVFHDDEVNRITRLNGPVSGFTSTELTAMDAGSWKNPLFTGNNIPLLEEVLQLDTGNTILNIEVKPGTSDTFDCHQMAEILVEELRGFNATNRVLVSSFEPSILYHVKELEPHIKTAILYDADIWQGLSPAQIVSICNCNAFSCSSSEISDNWIQELGHMGIPVNVYTVNDENQMRRLIRMGVDGIFSDNPALLQVVYLKENLPSSLYRQSRAALMMAG